MESKFPFFNIAWYNKKDIYDYVTIPLNTVFLIYINIVIVILQPMTSTFASYHFFTQFRPNNQQDRKQPVIAISNLKRFSYQGRFIIG